MTVHHVGISTRDLDRSVAFYKLVTGRDPELVGTLDGPAVASETGVDGAAMRVAFVRVGQARLELVQWLRPAPAPEDETERRAGALHVAFTVDDLDAEHRRLAEAGVTFDVPPTTLAEADGVPGMVGARYAYLSDPDGVTVELFQPNAKLAP